jgi:hypothetical protein
MYGEEDAFLDWLAASPRHRLVNIGQDTLRWTEEAARAVPDRVELDRFPDDERTVPPEARSARLLYIRSQFGHMTLVTGGVVLPLLMRLVPVPQLDTMPPLPPTLPAAQPILDAGIDDSGAAPSTPGP